MPFHAAELSAATAGSEPSDSVAMRTFRALECVARAAEPPTLEELTRTLRLPKPTVFRILRVLSDAGLVQREMHRKRYVVGPRAAAFALDVQIQSPRRGEQRAILERLVETIGETCNLTMLDANEVLYVERVETTANIRLHMQAGSRVPLHCTASGKLLLSALAPVQARRLLGPGPLRRFTSRTIVDPLRLENELDAIRANDFSTDNAEYLVDSVCLAVPVRDPRGRVCAAIAVHGPSPRMTVRKGVAFVPVMREAAAALAATWFERPSATSVSAARRRTNARRENGARAVEA